MRRGRDLGWLTVLAAVAALATAPTALGDRVTDHVRDEEALLVGEPTGLADLRVDPSGTLQPVEAGTYKEYVFEVEPADNRVEVDLRYDPGPAIALGPCLRASDLDLTVTGPEGWGRSLTACDAGAVTILGSDVPTGTYTARVEADHGSTLCLPHDADDPCTAPGIEYLFEATVLQIQ